MRYRTLRRAAMITVGVSLLTAGAAFADVVRTDGDTVDPDLDSLVELGPVAPGAILELDVGFELQCSGFLHVNADQSVVLTPGARTIPPGAGADYTGATIDPPGTGWPVDGEMCTSLPTPIQAATPAQVTLTAPTTAGEGYLFTLGWNRALSPVASGDFGTFSGVTAVTFSLDVVANTPPILLLPDGVVLEADQSGGASAAYDVAATDAEDDPDPAPSCAPAAGSSVPLGTTTVTCTVTDTGGLQATGTFDLTVVDTTAPSLAAVPEDVHAVTADPAGTAVTYAPPSATDVADPDPVVGCTPASGSTFPVGTTTVTCTATDASGNSASAAFNVMVSLWTASWDEPVGANATIVANAGRTIPIKVRLFADGLEITTGSPVLHAARCDSGGVAVLDGALTWGSGNGRWNGHLDTGLLPGTGCYTVSVMIEGLDVASFELDVVGSLTQAKHPARTKVTP